MTPPEPPESPPGSTGSTGTPGASGGLAVAVEGLRHSYGGVKPRLALAGVSFEVRRGEVAALLGPNGSGKSTAFRVLATLMTPAPMPGPDADPVGRVEVFGACPWEDPAAVRSRIGVVFQSPGLDPELTAEENLRCHGRLQGLGGAALREAVALGLERCDHTERAGDRVKTFSGGMKRRLEVAKAMLHGPELLLLDEPDAGLDPGARAELWEQLDALRAQAGTTVLLTTHLMDLAARADRLVLIDHGQVRATGTAAELIDAGAGEAVRLEPADGDAAALAADLSAGLPEGERLDRLRVDRFGARPSVRLRRRDAGGWVAGLRERWPGRFARVSYGPAALEDAFLELTTPRVESAPDEPAAGGWGGRGGRGRR